MSKSGQHTKIIVPYDRYQAVEGKTNKSANGLQAKIQQTKIAVTKI